MLDNRLIYCKGGPVWVVYWKMKNKSRWLCSRWVIGLHPRSDMTAPEVEGCSRGLIGLQQISGREAQRSCKGYSIAEERQSMRLWKRASFW